jgi:PKD repeat protein
MKQPTTHPRFTWLKLLILPLTLAFNTQAGAQCVASFTHTVNHATKTVTFTNTSTGSFTRSWWEYDGGIGMSTSTNPVKTFQNPGYHYVCLWVDKINDPTCHSGKVCDSIFISGSVPCVADWFYYGDSNSVMWYNATQSSGANLLYIWNFDDGSSDTTGIYPTMGHQFHRKGSHNVCLTVVNHLDTSCRSTSCKTITNSGTCRSNFYSYRDTLAPAYTFNYYPAFTVPGTTYLWSFDDSTTSTLQSPSHQYTTPGPHLVCLKVTNMADSCSSTSCDTITGQMISGIAPAAAGTKNTFSMSPNPAGNFLDIAIENGVSNDTRLSIYNTMGRKVTERTLEQQNGSQSIRMDIGALPAGIYFVEIKSSNLAQTKKFYKVE